MRHGPGTQFVGPLRTVRRLRNKVLGPAQYALIKNEVDGRLRNIIGPCLLQLRAYDVVVKIRDAITLKPNEYVRLVDDVTGEIRVEVGEKCVYINPTESLLDDGKRDCIAVDVDTAVVVRDISTGSQRLVTEEQMFHPSSTEDIVDVRQRIRLADFETAIIKDMWGGFHFISGAVQAHALDTVPPAADVAVVPSMEPGESKVAEHKSADKLVAGIGKAPVPVGSSGVDMVQFHIRCTPSGGVSFFLPPFCEQVKLLWSTGPKKDKRSLQCSLFDSRPRFDDYCFLCRTKDNVELDVEITFFWSLANVQKMMQNTDDAPGDICHHARSEIVQSVSQIDLDTFMQSFNEVVCAAAQRGSDFYSNRGVLVHSVEVRSFQCRDKAIDKVLQAIIRESTDRINRLQKIESENEVQIEKMKGDIQAERLKGELLDIRCAQGQAEAERLKAFLGGLNGITSTPEQAIALFKLLRKVDILSDLSKSNAKLFFTTEDVDLRINCNDGGELRPECAASAQEAKR